MDLLISPPLCTYSNGLGEADNSCLGGGVDGHLVDGIEASHGADVGNNATGTTLTLVPELQNGCGGVDQPGEVDSDGAFDLMIVQDASTVDQEIDGLQLVEDGLQQLDRLTEGHGDIVGIEGNGHLGIDGLQLSNGGGVLHTIEDHQVLERNYADSVRIGLRIVPGSLSYLGTSLDNLATGVQTDATQAGDEDHVLVGQKDHIEESGKELSV